MTDMPISELDPVELPLVDPPTDIPLWSENFCWEIGCVEQSIGIFIHLSRQSFDPSVWRETMVVMLPSGKIAVAKGYGRGAHPRGTGGAQIRISCQRSFEEWSVAFSGGARIVEPAELTPEAGGALRDGPYLPFTLSFDSCADTPPWDLGSAIATHSWGKAHYQQAVHVTGELCVEGERIAFDGVGMRDHTRGPRDFSLLGRWGWISGGIAGGRRFIALAMNPAPGTDQPPVRRAIIGDRDGIEIVETVRNDIVDDPECLHPVLELKRSDGSVDRIEIDRLRTVILSPGAPNQLMIGAAADATIYSCQSPARLVWNGEPCAGYVEQGREAR